MTYTQQLARWYDALDADAIPPELIAHARLRILDTLGCALAAAAGPYGRTVRAAALALGAGGPSRLLGSEASAAPAWAAMANGMLAHALIFDDTHNESIVHPSAPLVATALALADAQPCTGAEALVAFIGATEILCRVGVVARGRLHKSGFQPTAVVAPVAAALLACRLQGLGETEMVHAAGLTGSFASGITESWVDGTWAQLLHPGWAAHSGIAAAALAGNGYTGPATVLEGRSGLFRSHIQAPAFDFAFDRLLDGLGREWESRRISFKPYPCAHVVHAFIDAVLALRERGLRAGDVTRIVCPVAEYVVGVVCEPVEEKRRPASDAQARTSLQYTLAEALVRGRLDATSYGDALRDPAILSLADRVEFTIDATASGTRHFKGWVIAHTSQGRTLEHVVPFDRGSAENPIAESEIVRKFETNAALALVPSRVERVLELAMRIEALPSLADLTAACC